MDSWLQRIWYQRSLWVWLLLPLSLIFQFVVALRRLAFRVGVLRVVRVPAPVIVVGNITVGGTGKTPLVIWLAQELSRRGFAPGVITRGYGGASSKWPRQVAANSDPSVVGDEAVLLAKLSGAIVVAGPDRVADAEQAIALGSDVIISDDGLQHYRLARDFEIAVVDGARCFGNRYLLPAGPLREPVKRLDEVSAVVVTGRGPEAQYDALSHWRPIIVRNRLAVAVSLLTGERRPLSDFADNRVHAVAGIGNPAAFFSALSEHGLQVDGRALADHATIARVDLEFCDAAPVFMTEKDAVKCSALADLRMWAVPIELEVKDADQLLQRIAAAIRAN